MSHLYYSAWPIVDFNNMFTEWFIEHRLLQGQNSDFCSDAVFARFEEWLIENFRRLCASFWCYKHVEGIPLGFLHLRIWTFVGTLTYVALLAMGFKWETSRETGGWHQLVWLVLLGQWTLGNASVPKQWALGNVFIAELPFWG